MLVSGGAGASGASGGASIMSADAMGTSGEVAVSTGSASGSGGLALTTGAARRWQWWTGEDRGRANRSRTPVVMCR